MIIYFISHPFPVESTPRAVLNTLEKKEFLRSAQNDRKLYIPDRATVSALFGSKNVSTGIFFAPITTLNLTTYIYVKDAKSQVEGENGAINAEKGLFVSLDTWRDRTSLREFRM